MLNEEEFKELYNEFRQLVYNLALHYTQNAEDAQDITQEIFVKIYRSFEKYDSGLASLKTWIYRITVNYCLDFLRSRKKRRRFGFIAALFSNESNEPMVRAADFNHPGVVAEDRDELQNLFSLINQLPEKQKTALILTRIEDRPQRQVAEIMNISVKAVESLLQRARQTLEKKLKEREGLK